MISLKRGRGSKPLDPATMLRLTDTPQFSATIREGAQRFIADNALYEEIAESSLNPRKELDKIADRLMVATRKQHIEAVAFAYAFWVRASTNPAYTEFVARLARERRRVTRATTGLHLIVARFVSYGDDDTDPTGPKRGLYNRDVRAILWLQERGIAPDQAVAQSEHKGEGLREWDRRQRKPRNPQASIYKKHADFVQEHQRKRSMHTPIVPDERNLEICLSYRAGPNKGEHHFYELLGTREARQILDKFRSDICAEHNRVLQINARNRRIIFGLDEASQSVSQRVEPEPT